MNLLPAEQTVLLIHINAQAHLAVLLSCLPGPLQTVKLALPASMSKNEFAMLNSA